MRRVQGNSEKFKRTEEEINKFVEEINLINIEEIIYRLKEREQQEFGKYLDFLEKLETSKEGSYFSMTGSNLEVNQVIELAKKFFINIHPSFEEQVNDILDGKKPNKYNLDICKYEGKEISSCNRIEFAESENPFPDDMLEEIKQSNIDLYNEIMKMYQKKVIIVLKIAFTGHIGDLYCLVHELTHSFTTSKSSTNRIAGEIAPRCMERLLDDFLLNLSDEELKKYGLEKNEILKDIIKEKIASLASGVGALKKLDEEMIKNKYNSKGEITEEAEEYLKYVLAQIYQSQILKYNPKERKQKIVQFINCVKEDDLKKANKTFGIEWNNQLKRQFYIDKTVNDMKEVLEQRKLYNGAWEHIDYDDISKEALKHVMLDMDMIERE